LDIDGAKALEERLARNGAAKPRPAAGDIPEGAPPIYRWFAFGSSVDAATPASGNGSAESGSTLGPDGLGLPSTS
jgi:hypothetical protein